VCPSELQGTCQRTPSVSAHLAHRGTLIAHHDRVNKLHACMFVALTACNASSASPRELSAPTLAIASVAPTTLCVTSGKLEGVHVAVPSFRAVAPGHGGDAASLDVVVKGETAATKSLASGQERRQLGLKLRAENGCNLVYVMWRLDPKPKLEVSVKRNPGAHTAKDCGADGYTKVKPAFAETPPALDDGAHHTLRAEIIKDALYAWIDGRIAWRGTLPAIAGELSGPAGVRSDNLDFEITSFSADARALAEKPDAKCVD